MRPLRSITPSPKSAAMVRANSASDGRSFGQKNSKPQMPATSSPTDRPYQLRPPPFPALPGGILFGGPPGRPRAKDLQGTLVLFGVDLAAGEALPQDLLRRVPGPLRTVVSATFGKDACHGPSYEEYDPAPEQEGEEDPWPPEAATVVPGPRRPALDQEGCEHPYRP